MTNPYEITVSQSAAQRVAQLIAKENNPNNKLRVAVDGGGCSGFQYRFEFDETKNADDIMIKKDGVSVLIDEISADFIKGSVIDFVDDLGASHFAVKNPNATASCGCGNSFAV